MTIKFNNVIVNETKMIVIEVAFFISILRDATGADEGRRKEKVPKALNYCGSVLGHTSNSCMTVIEL